MPSVALARIWFEKWREPAEFLRAAYQSEALVPLNKALPQHLRDAYVAGLFARIWNNHRPCEVRLVPDADHFPDAQIRESSALLDFEITVADKRNRRMFAEHREWHERQKGGQLPLIRNAKRQEIAREAIARVCEGKARRYLAGQRSNQKVRANLLIYVNPGAVLSPDEMTEITKPWRGSFTPIWLLAGASAVRSWPTQKILNAVRDPFA